MKTLRETNTEIYVDVSREDFGPDADSMTIINVLKREYPEADFVDYCMVKETDKFIAKLKK